MSNLISTMVAETFHYTYVFCNIVLVIAANLCVDPLLGVLVVNKLFLENRNTFCVEQ